MAIVPKNKVSKQRSNMRYANWRLSSPGIGSCPNCHESKMHHRVCKHCGFYDGVQKREISQKTED
ncbi:MAG: 50S ribosomal protein L32 [Firmicutes bacterium]|nr:50S ribosomal protein L32 [Bacillota bacterium]